MGWPRGCAVAGVPSGRARRRHGHAGSGSTRVRDRGPCRCAGDAAMTRAASRRSARPGSERGQAVVMVLLIGLVIAVVGGFLFAYGQALGSRGRYQRVADLTAMSAARVMRTSYPRLFEPPVLPDGIPNPAYMSKLQYLALARAAAGSAAVRNGVRLGIGDVSFPDLLSFAPTRVRVLIRKRPVLRLPSFGGRRLARLDVAAKARAAVRPSAGVGALLPTIVRGGYGVPLARRQGKPMRPDTAAAFD